MARQRLRKTRLDRQTVRPSAASDGKTETRLDATRVGGERKRPSETRVPTLDPAQVTRALAIDPDAQVQVVRRGKNRMRGNLLTYFDPSRKR